MIMEKQKFELNLRRRNIPKEELLDDLKRVANLINQHTMTYRIYVQKGKFSTDTICRQFGSWNQALEAAGLKVINTKNNKKEVLFENLANVWQHLGRQPVYRDLDKANGYSKISSNTYVEQFGSWNKALQVFVAYIEDPAVLKDATIENLDVELKRKGSGRTPRDINWRLRATVLIKDNCICRMCGASPAKDSAVVLHVDHIKPWSKGGETGLENLQTLCSVCNIRKERRNLLAAMKVVYGF